MITPKERKQFLALAKQSCWVHRKRLPLTENQKYWLRGNQSLTKQLVLYSQGDFSLEVIRELRQRPFAHEARKLNVPLHRSCVIREVLLICNNEPTVFARSVISDKAIKASKHQLTKLGKTPLGHLLFNQAKVNLDTRDVAKTKQNNQKYFSRRTLYQLNKEDILVSEFFISPPWEK